jgi:hypothetical protein
LAPEPANIVPAGPLPPEKRIPAVVQQLGDAGRVGAARGERGRSKAAGHRADDVDVGERPRLVGCRGEPAGLGAEEELFVLEDRDDGVEIGRRTRGAVVDEGFRLDEMSFWVRVVTTAVLLMARSSGWP